MKDKKNRHLILFDYKSIKNNQANPELLLESLNKNGNSYYDYGILEDFVFYIKEDNAVVYNDKLPVSVDEYESVYFRRWQNNTSIAKSLAVYFDNKAVRVFDSELSVMMSVDKSNQMMILASNKVPVPVSLFYGGSEFSKEMYAKLISEKLVFPIIMKSVSGTRGSDNYLVNSKVELDTILANNKSVMLAQEYIENDRDYRCWVTGDECDLIVVRTRKQGHLNNTSQGANSEVIEVSRFPNEALKVAIKSAKVLKRDIAGVDIIIKDNRAYVLEVNRSPQLEQTTFIEEKAKTLTRYIEKYNKI